MDAPVLQGEHVTLRPIEPTDLGRLVEILAEPSVQRWWGDEDRAYMEREYVNSTESQVWAIVREGRMVGMIQAYEETDPGYLHAGIDIALSTEHQGRGHGTQALRLVAAYLIRKKGHHRLIIDPSAANERAIHTYTKIGFRPVGIMRRYERDSDGGGWHDGLLMDMLADEFDDGTGP